jgi:hypothetical protein
LHEVINLTARETIHVIGAIADLKEVTYKNTLAVTTLIDLLIEKGMITHTEIAERAQKLDQLG